jgi:hypothetical protein
MSNEDLAARSKSSTLITHFTPSKRRSTIVLQLTVAGASIESFDVQEEDKGDAVPVDDEDESVNEPTDESLPIMTAREGQSGRWWVNKQFKISDVAA